MPINPFQTQAEMSWGGYSTQKQNAGVVGGRLGGGIEKGYASRANMQAPTIGELKPTPKAGGSMPQGNADIRRPDYGSQQQQPQRNGRLASFGGMAAGATKGGGSGMTAGGDIKFDLRQDNSNGKTDLRGANLQNARGLALGQGAKISDSNSGDIDQSQTYSPSTTAKAGSSRSGAGAAGKGGAGGSKAGAGSGAAGAGAAGRGGAGGNAARGGDTGSMNTNMSGQKMGSPTLNIGRNRIDSDNVSRRTKTTSTDVRASGSATASADSKDARKVTPAKPKKEKTATEPAVTSPATKEDPKAEATGKETVKEKAKKAVAKSATKVATKATASATKDKKVRAVKTASKTKKEEEEE